jgi:hypothetical protein
MLYTAKVTCYSHVDGASSVPNSPSADPRQPVNTGRCPHLQNVPNEVTESANYNLCELITAGERKCPVVAHINSLADAEHKLFQYTSNGFSPEIARIMCPIYRGDPSSQGMNETELLKTIFENFETVRDHVANRLAAHLADQKKAEDRKKTDNNP